MCCLHCVRLNVKSAPNCIQRVKWEQSGFSVSGCVGSQVAERLGNRADSRPFQKYYVPGQGISPYMPPSLYLL